ncbi:MAG TPA: GcrA family cell cycle regulator [Xanthobacteraceae bacterium]|jgi:GcrA cell cycle regulator|nr:GcrA family cell cycle regulator [Xanthobacteraceae bacterium]
MSARTLMMLRDQDQDARDAAAESNNSSPPRHSKEATKSTTRPGVTWTSERIAQLKSAVEAGLTCSQIAAEIGVSRNAVIGKISRLGLSRRRKQAAPREAKPKRTVFRARSLARILARQQLLSGLNAASPCGAPAIAILNGRGCSLFELTPGKCRWPINDPGTDDFCFCGSEQVQGLPYCLGHVRLAYRSTAGLT